MAGAGPGRRPGVRRPRAGLGGGPARAPLRDPGLPGRPDLAVDPRGRGRERRPRPAASPGERGALPAPPESRTQGTRRPGTGRPPHRAARLWGHARGLPQGGGGAGPARRLPAGHRRRADLLDRGRRQRGHPGGAGRRGRRGGGRQAGVLGRALPLRRGSAVDVERRPRRAVARGGRSADPHGAVGHRPDRPRGDGVRGRGSGGLVAGGPLSRHQSQWSPPDGDAVPRHPAVPGRSALAVPQHARGRLPDPRFETRGAAHPRQRRAGRDRARGAHRLRRHHVRRGGHLGVPAPRPPAAAVPGPGPVGGRLRGAGLCLRSGPGGRGGREPPAAAPSPGLATAGAGGSGARGRGEAEAMRRGLARAPRPRRPATSSLGGRRRGGGARPAGLHPHQPGRRRDPAGLALVPALLDPGRRADRLGAAAARARGGGPRVHRVVRALPVPERQGAVLRGCARGGPGARARQRGRVHLPGGGVLPLHRRPRADRAPVAARARRRGLSGLAAASAPHAGVPGRRPPGVLRPAAAVDQPRRLLGQADALLLGRSHGATRLQGHRGVGAGPGPAARGLPLERRPGRVRARPGELGAEHDGPPPHRLRAGMRRSRRLRRHGHDHRPRSGRGPGGAAAGGVAADVREVLGVLLQPPRRGGLGRLHALRASQRRRLRAPGLARAREPAARLLPRRAASVS